MNNNIKRFEKPTLEIITFSDDIITTSGTGTYGNTEPGPTDVFTPGASWW